MIVVTDTTYVSMVWFAAWQNTDWLAILYKNSPLEQNWHLADRFRYYDPADPDNDAFSGKDCKSGYSATFKGAEEVARTHLRHVGVMLLQVNQGEELHEVAFETVGPEAFTAILAKQSWAEARPAERGQP